MNYEELSDEAIVELSRKGDRAADEILYDRYKNVVRMKAHPYFLVGADREDLVQEGMIGFYKATRDYENTHGASFRSFAEMCITRQIISAIKSATRKKHTPLNTYVSIYKKANEEEGERSVLDTAAQLKVDGPEESFIVKESMQAMLEGLNSVLSPLEKQTLVLFLEGKSYMEIAEEIGRTTKTVDNSLQRIKKKVEKLLKAEK
ncbi:MAG: RNA polymerase sporulation sigma factor SigH [Clostridia bacterium]|nr:RNA polymerase sporulation sigma factor SigH [Clostridia bacterium]